MTTGSRNAPPHAGAMLESLRGLGYSVPAAIADIIDNSISAESTEVRINFTWNGPFSRISFVDNGTGMSDSELESAMRLGDKNPLDQRSAKDLGRFGMGLKTASFSHCRRLTVASVKNGMLSCLRWDLEELASKPEAGWLLYEGPSHGSEPFFSELKTEKSGTLVLWEILDRVVTKGFDVDDFFSLIDNVEAHLAMVFHRLIQGPKPSLRIFLNDKQIVAWDPFMSWHSGKPWNSPIERKHTPSGTIEIECHVLPHRDKLSEKEFQQGGGPDGWTSQQGFYVYRNQRLLLAGGWLGLGHGKAWNREESFRLARIRLDIPNTADADWKIDIRKSTAKPPVIVRPWLTKFSEDTRDRARKVFAYRGSPTTNTGHVVIEQAWRAEHTKSGIRYKIDVNHPAVSAVIEESGKLEPLLKAMLRVIEETVPVQRIWLDTAENNEVPNTGFAGEPPENVIQVLGILYADMVKRKGMSTILAKKTLLNTEPFQNYPNLVSALPDDLPVD